MDYPAERNIQMIEQECFDEVSDGYHTFGELYEHRHALFLALIKQMPNRAWASAYRHDGTKIDGWFIAGIHLPTGDITYHLPDGLWAALPKGIEKRVHAIEWDGHTPADVVQRIQSYLHFQEHPGTEGD